MADQHVKESHEKTLKSFGGGTKIFSFTEKSRALEKELSDRLFLILKF